MRLMLNFGVPCCYAHIYTTLTVFYELSRELPWVKEPLYIADNPCACLLPHLCGHDLGEAGKWSFASGKDCVPDQQCLSVTLNSSVYLPGPQFIHLLQAEDICPTPPSCCWEESNCHPRRHRCVGTVQSSRGLPAVWSADLATKGLLSRTPHGEPYC